MNYLPLKDFHGTHDYWEVRKKETITLAHGSSEVCGPIGNTPGSNLWNSAGSLPVSYPLLGGGSLLNLKMLDIARKAPASASPTPEPKEEEQTTLLVLKEPCAPEPEEAVHLAWELDLVWGRFPSVPPGFPHSCVNWTQTGLARGIPLGTQLDLHSLGSLQMTISHYPAVRHIWCEYQILDNNSGVTAYAPVQTPQNHLTPLQTFRNFEWKQHSSCHPPVTPLLLNSLIPTMWLKMHYGVYSCQWLLQVNTRLLWLLSNPMLPNTRIIWSSSTLYHFFWVARLLYMIINTWCCSLIEQVLAPQNGNRTSGEVTL